MKTGHTCVQCGRKETSNWYWTKKQTPTCAICYKAWYKVHRKEQYEQGIKKQNSRPEAKARRKAYEKSTAGKISRHKYNTSKKGLKSKRKWNKKPEAKLLMYIKTAERRYKKALARPEWVTGELVEQINNFYRIANEQTNEEIKYAVDHIIPIKGKKVSGLDVPWNLQVLTASENSCKLNKFDGTYDNEGWRDDYNLVREGET